MRGRYGFKGLVVAVVVVVVAVVVVVVAGVVVVVVAVVVEQLRRNHIPRLQKEDSQSVNPCTSDRCADSAPQTANLDATRRDSNN